MTQNNRKRSGGNGRQGTGRSRKGQEMSTSQILGAANQYASALMRGDEETLSRMSLYSEGAIGAKGSNLTALKRTGASRILESSRTRKGAMVTFGQEGSTSPVCIARFTVVDPAHVMGDWQIFVPG